MASVEPSQQAAGDSSKQPKEGIAVGFWLAVQLAWDMGWIIAIPAVAFGFGGAYLDKIFGTTPLCILVGLLIALILSFLGLRKKFKDILQKRF